MAICIHAMHIYILLMTLFPMMAKTWMTVPHVTSYGRLKFIIYVGQHTFAIGLPSVGFSSQLGWIGMLVPMEYILLNLLYTSRACRGQIPACGTS